MTNPAGATLADSGSLPGTALETLGTVIPEDQGRDAVHLAAVAVRSERPCYPGQQVGLVGDKMVSADAAELIGIVDPFLTSAIPPHNWFWMLLYPRTITSLRHVWTHPAFAEGAPAIFNAVEESERWIAEFAADLDLTVNQVMRGAELWEATSPTSEWGGEYTYENGENYKDMPEERFAEFWQHYERVKGQPLGEGVKRESFFTCSC